MNKKGAPQMALIIVGVSIHQGFVGLRTILAILLDASGLLERDDSLLGFIAEVRVCAILGQLVPQLHQQLLHGLHIGAFHAFFEQTGAECVVGRRRNDSRAVVVINERQLIPVRPAAALDLGLHASIRKAFPFDSIAVTNVITNVTVLVKRHANDLRQGVNGTPIHALALGIGEHAVSRFVGAVAAAILA